MQEKMGEGVTIVVSTEVTRLQVFNKTLSKISEFIIACKLYIRMKMKEATVKKQI